MSVLAVPRRAVLADFVPGALARDVALVVAGAALTGLAAQVALPVPGSPVPITGQTFAALLVGASLGWQRGVTSMVLYLIAGVAGVPWFQGGSSGAPASLGYVIGFVFAGAVVGALAARGGDRTPVRTVGTMALGSLVIYAFGVPWLMAAADMGFGTALQVGVVPFLIGDAVKTVLAAGLLPASWSLVRRFRS
ncbi:biotin transporter BioY [Umezawaea beigongshangensis]|uniref:biotin transporter BioY n=1 Tax=Umezawaea beigongshangensis TaxID=2780383 RepID=UPI0018F1BBA3|nr:biotin transporter BioY [Umezawaea beigongshangensis]